MSKSKEAGEIPIGPNGAKLKDVLRAVLTAPVAKSKKTLKKSKKRGRK